MRHFLKYHILCIVTVFTVTMFFSCKDNYDQVQKIGVSENEPIGEAENINLKYTDSGRVAINLISPKRLDFSNRNFPYEEFPEGITLYFFDKDNNKSTVVSDYAISYKQTDLIDLQGNVVITSHEGVTLKTKQLYFKQKNKWLFSNNYVEIEDENSLIKGNTFDAKIESGKGIRLSTIYETHDTTIEIEE